MEIEIFENLKKEVIDKNHCNLCGACIAVCEANENNAIYLKDNRPEYKNFSADTKKCLECGICYLICGQIPKLNHEIEKKYSFKPPIGYYRYLTCMRTTNPEIQKNAQDGGIVTTILKYLLEKNFIDGAVVNKPIGNWDAAPELITASDNIVKTAGTRYFNTPSVQALGGYKKLEKDNPRLAFVGSPCQVQTIRKMQILKIRPGIYVKFLIGLFCMENFNYTSLIKEKIERDLRINLDRIKKMNIKGNFFIELENNEQIEIPLKDLSHLVRENCHLCTDFTNVYADVSVGGIGAPAGYSTVLVRTKKVNNLFVKMVNEKEIQEYGDLHNKNSEIKTKILSQITKLAQRKYDSGVKRRSIS